MGPRVLVAEVVDIAGDDGRQPRRRGELVELRQDPLLDREVRVLELDVDVVAAEDLREPVEFGARVGHPSLLERLADPPRETARKRDHAL